MKFLNIFLSTGMAFTSLCVYSQNAPSTSTTGTGINPSISLILSGGYNRSRQNPDDYKLTGFHQSTDAEGIKRGFSLGETELGFYANIDPWWFGSAMIALDSDSAISIEEAFVQTSRLGNGLTAKMGRHFSGIGYLNPQHAHTWDFIDAPLAYQAFLGGQLKNDGVRMSWLMPTDQFVQLGLEVGQGNGFPSSNANQNKIGHSALTLHTGGDIGPSHNWRAGISSAQIKATDLSLMVDNFSNESKSSLFSGNTQLLVLDGVWKWAPNGNTSRNSFQLQGEYIKSKRSGDLTLDTFGANITHALSLPQSGWYLQGVYQFQPLWRAGIRVERLDSGTPVYAANALGGTQYNPSKNTALLEWRKSEFSKFRAQIANDYSREGAPDRIISLQYQMSLGAHRAHSY